MYLTTDEDYDEDIEEEEFFIKLNDHILSANDSTFSKSPDNKSNNPQY
jgi:hypothetical protein